MYFFQKRFFYIFSLLSLSNKFISIHKVFMFHWFVCVCACTIIHLRDAMPSCCCSSFTTQSLYQFRSCPEYRALNSLITVACIYIYIPTSTQTRMHQQNFLNESSKLNSVCSLTSEPLYNIYDLIFARLLLCKRRLLVLLFFHCHLWCKINKLTCIIGCTGYINQLYAVYKDGM